MTLTIVKPPEAVENLKVLLYAGPGVGKSVGAGTAPGPILWLNAEGPDALRYARHIYGDDKILEVEVIDKETLTDAYLYAKDPANGIATIVVDTLGEVYRLLLAARAAKGTGTAGKGQPKNHKPSMSDYGDANQDLLGFIRVLRDLPLNVVLIAHEMTLDVTDDDGDDGTEKFPFCGTNKPTVSQQAMGMMQIVGYVGRVAPENEGEDPKWVCQVVPAKGRKGKDRTIAGIGDERGVAPLDIEAWVAAEIAATTPKKRSAA